MIKDQIQSDIKEAMKAGDKPRLATLRMVLSGIKDFEINERKPAADSDVIRILRKSVKTRKDSIEEFRKGGRSDLIEKEEAEIGVIESYLPPEVDESAIRAMVETVIRESGANGMKDMGRVMKEVIARFHGAVDGGTVNRFVKERLSA